MSRKLQTLDLEFDEWCHELLSDEVESLDFLRILHQSRPVWDACRRRCADLCIQKGLVDMARDIMKNEGE
jgi:hypothetical protein